MARPAPTSPKAGARSSTVTAQPACASEVAEASPAIPPPTTIAVSRSATGPHLSKPNRPPRGDETDTAKYYIA
ncbi:hypothetical protein GCM10029978_111260 [Actinoallomurus acanthiterrae]